jgi:anti-sigma B factor antagonist
MTWTNRSDGGVMEMQINEVGGNVTQIVLIGRLDTPGVGRIETRFLAAVVPPGKPVVVDLSKVDFIASLGVRMLLSAARSLKQKEVKLALYAPQHLVSSVFDGVSLSHVVPICPDADDALAAVRT